VAFVLHGLVSASFAGRIPGLQDKFDLTAGGLGLALLMPAIGCVSTMQFISVLAQRVGQRVTLLTCLGLWSVMLTLAASAPNQATMYVLLFIAGIGAGSADVSMNALGVHLERRVGRSIMSGLHGFWSIGGMFGALAAAVCAHFTVPIAGQFAGVAAIAIVVGMVCYPQWADPVLDQSKPILRPGFAWPSKQILLIGLVTFAAIFAEGASLDWSAVFLREVTSAAVGIAALAVFAVMTTMAVGRFSGDYVVRRFGSVATVRLAGLIATVGVIFLLTTSTTWTVLIAFGAIGLGIAVVAPLAFAAAGRIGGAQPGQQIAAVATIGYGAGMASPAVIGAIAAASSIQAAFAVVGILTLLIVALASRLRTTDPDPMASGSRAVTFE
jgi:fucose permease